MKEILLPTLLIIAYLYGTGASELLKQIKFRNPAAFFLGITVAAPLVVWYGVLSIVNKLRWRLNRWKRFRKFRRALKQIEGKLQDRPDLKEEVENIRKLLKK